MAKYTKEQVMQMVRENNVRFIRLQFTDILGSLKNVAITDKQLEKALKNDCMFDGSSIEGFVRIEESDMRLYPDLDSFVIYPWTPKEHRHCAFDLPMCTVRTIPRLKGIRAMF